MQLLTRHISTLAVDLYFFKKIRTIFLSYIVLLRIMISNLFSCITYRSTEAIIRIIY